MHFLPLFGFSRPKNVQPIIKQGLTKKEMKRMLEYKENTKQKQKFALRAAYHTPERKA